jgi:hypothetical protein
MTWTDWLIGLVVALVLSPFVYLITQSQMKKSSKEEKRKEDARIREERYRKYRKQGLLHERKQDAPDAIDELIEHGIQKYGSALIRKIDKELGIEEEGPKSSTPSRRKGYLGSDD